MLNAQETMTGEIIVDNFAGGGGASTGVELATGRAVAIAINHDPDAILMHRTNHPYTEHLQAKLSTMISSNRLICSPLIFDLSPPISSPAAYTPAMSSPTKSRSSA